jgi:hypothetical protein
MNAGNKHTLNQTHIDQLARAVSLTPHVLALISAPVACPKESSSVRPVFLIYPFVHRSIDVDGFTLPVALTILNLPFKVVARGIADRTESIRLVACKISREYFTLVPAGGEKARPNFDSARFEQAHKSVSISLNEFPLALEVALDKKATISFPAGVLIVTITFPQPRHEAASVRIPVRVRANPTTVAEICFELALVRFMGSPQNPISLKFPPNELAFIHVTVLIRV